MQEVPSFEETHPYGFTPDQLSIAVWLLFTILGMALFAFIYSVFCRVRENGVSTRTLMGMRKSEKQEREERVKTRMIVERQRRNAQRNESENRH